MLKTTDLLSLLNTKISALTHTDNLVSKQIIIKKQYDTINIPTKKEFIISIEDSITTILTTILGSRIMLEWYGSKLHELIDKRMNKEWILDFRRYTYLAIQRCEKRVKLSNVEIISYDAVAGTIEFNLNFENNIILRGTQSGYITK